MIAGGGGSHQRPFIPGQKVSLTTRAAVQFRQNKEQTVPCDASYSLISVPSSEDQMSQGECTQL